MLISNLLVNLESWNERVKRSWIDFCKIYERVIVTDESNVQLACKRMSRIVIVSRGKLRWSHVIVYESLIKGTTFDCS